MHHTKTIVVPVTVDLDHILPLVTTVEAMLGGKGAKSSVADVTQLISTMQAITGALCAKYGVSLPAHDAARVFSIAIGINQRVMQMFGDVAAPGTAESVH